MILIRADSSQKITSVRSYAFHEVPTDNLLYRHNINQNGDANDESACKGPS